MLPTSTIKTRNASLAGQRGRIECAAEHPSPWLTVRLETGLIVRLHPNDATLLLLETTDAILGGKRETLLSSMHNDSSRDSSTVMMMTASSSPPSFTPLLKPGTAVTIMATENVQQRAPQRVGERGVVKEVPVHPITWFKVEFADGKVLAFRPSALLPFGEESPSAASPRMKASFPAAKPSRLFPLETSLECNQERGNLLNRTVLIRSGVFIGEKGRVLRCGKDWMHIETNFGDVSKRLDEVEFLGVPVPPRARVERSLIAISESPSHQPQNEIRISCNKARNSSEGSGVEASSPVEDVQAAGLMMHLRTECNEASYLPLISWKRGAETATRRRSRSDSCFTDHELPSPDIRAAEGASLSGDSYADEEECLSLYKRVHIGNDIPIDGWMLPPSKCSVALQKETTLSRAII